MPTQQASNESARDQRILANCKKIWSHVREFEIDLDCDDGPWGDCQAMVREARCQSFGPVLAMTNVCDESESAWKELDRMLRLRGRASSQWKADEQTAVLGYLVEGLWGE